MPYPESIVEGHRESVKQAGATSLEDPSQVTCLDGGRSIVVVNSVCGCASETLIPALEASLADVSDDVSVYTVFAGVDDEVTERARSYFTGCDDSSPSIGFLRDGELVNFVSRADIMSVSPDGLADKIHSLADDL